MICILTLRYRNPDLSPHLDIALTSLSTPLDPMYICAMTWLRDFNATSFTQFGAFFGGEIISVLFGEKI